MTPESQPHATNLWDRLPDETDHAFSLFQKYLELGPDATLADFAAQNGKSEGAIRNLSYRHFWSDRATAWRQSLAHIHYESAGKSVRDEAVTLAARRSLQRQLEWENGQAMAKLARAIAKAALDNPESSSKLPVYAIPQLLDASSKLCRLATEPPTGPDNDAAVTNQFIEDFTRNLQIAYGEAAAKLTIQSVAADARAEAEVICFDI